MTDRFPGAVLFDLDGTLLDSAPDMLAAVNTMRAARGIAPMLLSELRPHVSKGSRAMVQAAFPDLDPAAREGWIPEFLDVYQSELGRHCGPFDGIETMLGRLEQAGSVWGIVTNKPEYLAAPLLPMLGWQDRCRVLIGGDSLPQRKPDPAPLHAAIAALGPGKAVFIGDSEVDAETAHAAGVPLALYTGGYRKAAPGDLAAKLVFDHHAALPRLIAHLAPRL